MLSDPQSPAAKSIRLELDAHKQFFMVSVSIFIQLFCMNTVSTYRRATETNRFLHQNRCIAKSYCMMHVVYSYLFIGGGGGG